MSPHSKDVHSKDVHPKDVHPKDVAAFLARRDVTPPLPDVILAWGPLAFPVVIEAQPATLVHLAVRSIEALTDAGVITADQSAELQARIRGLENLARLGLEPSPVTAPPEGEPLPSVFEIVAATLPDPSLSGFWDVTATGVVAMAGVIGDAVAPGVGGPRGAMLAALAWPEWAARQTAST
ncbi:hypothetical protein I6A60_19780 [Frankia sp. AgB1.9]|uniref:hypothetical protein n=1 Tax=unclassified Frankia TaxID=2632575 RepID=UPI0019313028|nr:MULTISPECIES: hypothetical protein [unclassified Frankia]MBL7491509.1 hypothetical protein [Frankia sp. AgW1.1]MBL7550103.1 hypothetical protein [Frankia sp. AgB1.9]MBL7621153.1 hypothetical protein [Frankia sp. AgB1.8]